ncbi:MAG: DUF488 domain-containing protein [Burkholderiales bacterium]
MNLPFYTIGHSNRSMAEFVALLKAARVTAVADVRKMPRSRANPQFNLDTIKEALLQSGIAYHHIPELGGLRRPTLHPHPSPNMFWDNKSFRNYADYAATGAFQDGLAELRSLGHAELTAVMCAEAVWWRCHRRIIADYLLANGELVFHILGPGAPQLAKITTGARYEDGILNSSKVDS